jgi:NitT/TauT family transport system ATP-binding protein
MEKITAGTPMSRSAITMHEIDKRFYGKTAILALEKVSLEIADNEFAVLLGPSGCGKSTLMNIVAGFEAATGGSTRVFGETVAGPGPDRAVVFQESALFPWRNVWENVVFGPQLQGKRAADYEDRAREFLELMGLADFHNALPAELSGGMKQRVGIARALVMTPRILLMDEPFGALDAQTRLSMQGLLLEVWQRFQKTVLFITHDIDEAILLADTVYVMTARPGRIGVRIPVSLPRPRSIELITDPAFNELRGQIMRELRAMST